MLCHVHISAKTTAARPAKGNVRWCENFDALRSINYNGWLVVEAFGLALPEIGRGDKNLAANVSKAKSSWPETPLPSCAPKSPSDGPNIPCIESPSAT